MGNSTYPTYARSFWNSSSCRDGNHDDDLKVKMGRPFPRVAKTKPIPEGFHAVTPSLTLKNSRGAIEFYKKAFGAKVLDVLPAPDGKRTMHAMIQIGDSFLMMGDEMPDQGCQSAESLGSSPVSLYVYVPNVDQVFKQAVAAGAAVTMPVADMFWGDRCGT